MQDQNLLHIFYKLLVKTFLVRKNRQVEYKPKEKSQC